jgi:hypothetical protein
LPSKQVAAGAESTFKPSDPVAAGAESLFADIRGSETRNVFWDRAYKPAKENGSRPAAPFGPCAIPAPRQFHPAAYSRHTPRNGVLAAVCRPEQRVLPRAEPGTPGPKNNRGYCFESKLLYVCTAKRGHAARCRPREIS